MKNFHKNNQNSTWINVCEYVNLEFQLGIDNTFNSCSSYALGSELSQVY